MSEEEIKMAASTNSSVVSSPSQTREESVLEAFFTLLSQFSFDKAKDLMDREKEFHKTSTSTSWGTVLQCLSQLAVAEKIYMSLSSLGQKHSTIRFHAIVRPKENLRTLYHFLGQEFSRLEEACHQDNVGGATLTDIEFLLAHLSGQLCQYLTARQTLADVYENISRQACFEDLLTMLVDIIYNNHKTFHHPLLSPLKSTFTLECEILQHLLQAQLLLSDWQFLPSLLELHQTYRSLSVWSNITGVAEIEKLKKKNKNVPKNIHVPALYLWLQKFHGLLVSKFSLYFYEILAKQTPGDMKNWTSRATEDFVYRLLSFQKKYDATNIYLILDTNGQREMFRGPGYHHPDKYVEAPRGKDTYPFILCLPHEKPPDNIQTCILMNFTDRDMTETGPSDRLKTVVDKANQRTFYISRLEKRISIVILFDIKKSVRDSNINSFVLDLSSQLRCLKVIASLKPGAKS